MRSLRYLSGRTLLPLPAGAEHEIHIAIVELELQDFDGWDLIRRITFRAEKPVKIIATTTTYPESFFEKIKAIGVDRVVTKTISPEVWHKAVQGISEENEYAQG